MQSVWTEENIQRLKDCVDKGLSASQTAKELGLTLGIYFSRNAVIGKIHRLGLSLIKSTEKYVRTRDGSVPRKYRNTAMLDVKPKKVSLASIVRQAVALPEPDLEPIYFEQLERHHCRWPKDGDGLHTRYCGAWRVDPHPYCAHHCGRAYQLFRR